MTGKNRIMIYGPKGTALTSSSSGPPMATCCRSRSREPEAHPTVTARWPLLFSVASFPRHGDQDGRAGPLRR
jgi:hypothetical protein